MRSKDLLRAEMDLLQTLRVLEVMLYSILRAVTWVHIVERHISANKAQRTPCRRLVRPFPDVMRA